MARSGFGDALRLVRTTRGLTQEGLEDVCTRKYISLLEQGQKSPTLKMVEALSEAMNIHPLGLLLLCYSTDESLSGLEELAKKATSQAKEILEDSN